MSYIERPRFSCTLGGALDTINSIPGAVPIIHAASGCGGNLFGSQQLGGAYGSGYCGGLSVPSSNITENDIIFGGEARLEEQIRTTLEVIDADLFIVVSGCMTEIIGDDLKTVAGKFKDLSKTVLAVDTGGFKGNSYKGYDLVLQTIFTDYVPQAAAKKKNLVNILGVVPSKDPFFRGDLEEIRRLLGLIGIESNTLFGYDDTLESLSKAGEASANIVLSRVYGLEAAESFLKKHGTPFIVEDIPIGAAATAEFLRKIAGFLGLDHNVVKKAVEEEIKHYYYYIERIADTYLDADLQHFAIVVGNANYCYPVTRYLAEDLGWLPELSVITDELPEADQETLKRAFQDFERIKVPEVIFETNTSEILPYFTKKWNLPGESRYFNAASPLFILGSSLERELAENLKAKMLHISYPLVNRVVMDKGYAGFKGGLHLFEDILNVVMPGRE